MVLLFPLSVGGTYGALHIATDDADALWERAVAAGATVHQPLQDMFWGDRHGQVIDPFGHRWGISRTSTTCQLRRSPGPQQRCSAARRADVAPRSRNVGQNQLSLPSPGSGRAQARHDAERNCASSVSSLPLGLAPMIRARSTPPTKTRRLGRLRVP
jgi:hypothetical protein